MTRMSLPTVESCDGCGACCMEMRSPPFVALMAEDGPRLHAGGRRDDLDFRLLKRMPKPLYDEVLARKRSDAPEDAPCSWYDQESRRCLHHDLRPRVCRDFEVGSAGCHRWRRRFGIEENVRRSITSLTTAGLT